MRKVAEAFDVASFAKLPPHYNIAPTQTVPVVRCDSQGRRELAMLNWGLVPSWADDPSVGSRMINARAETLATRPAYREAFRSRRCLVVADGFFEWQRDGRRKQPYYITHANEQLLGFAGLWESWKRGDLAIQSCTIVTTDANRALAPLHNRMPAIVRPEDYAAWLDPKASDAAALSTLLRPYAEDELVAYPVRSVVNSASADTPNCIERYEPVERERRLF